MNSWQIQVLLNNKNIKKLIKRINELEDRLEALDKIRTLRPMYHPDFSEDTGLPIA